MAKKVTENVQNTGKRKSAVARIILQPRKSTEGKITVNQRTFEEYFPRPTSRRLILQPLEITQTVGQYDIRVNVRGGGLSGQAGAVKHGIAKALVKINNEYRPALRKAGHITRDSREVERKKAGLAGARRRFQYSKR